MNDFTFPEVAVAILVSIWIFRELWTFFLRRPISSVSEASAGAHDDAPETSETPERLPIQPVVRTDYLIAIAIAACWYLLALWRLGAPDQQYFDEVYHARSGMEYVLGQDPHEWTHPPLAKLLIAGSLLLWRVRFDPTDAGWHQDAHYTAHQAFAWRYPSVVFGAGALLLLYALARSLFRNRAVATAATVCFALDGLFFVQSRIAMTNTFTVFFVLLATLGTWKFLSTHRYRFLFLTGLGLGLALATRWSTMWAWGVTGLLLLWDLGTKQWPKWTASEQGVARPLLKWVGTAALAMLAMPVAIYALSYIPNVLQGTGDLRTKLFTLDGAGGDHSWRFVLNFKDGMQHNMWAYHSGIKDKHSYSSPWWSWPFEIRPAWYFFDRDKAGLVRGVWAIGNLAIWWASLPAFVTLAVLAFREKRKEFGLIALFGLGMWLPWGIEPRSLVFMHYYYECIPYACLGIGYLGCRLWYSGDEGKRTFAACYAVLIAAWFLFWYPLLSAYPISERYYEMHLWMGRPWI